MLQQTEGWGGLMFGGSKQNTGSVVRQGVRGGGSLPTQPLITPSQPLITDYYHNTDMINKHSETRGQGGVITHPTTNYSHSTTNY